VVALLILGSCGVMMLKQENLLYLGVLLGFICPVLAFQWYLFGHFFIWRLGLGLGLGLGFWLGYVRVRSSLSMVSLWAFLPMVVTLICIQSLYAFNTSTLYKELVVIFFAFYLTGLGYVSLGFSSSLYMSSLWINLLLVEAFGIFMKVSSLQMS